MELKQLACYVTVAEELNFTTAAERLYLSQPSLSRHIHQLEQELGLRLFIRDRKTVTLTNAGVQLLSTARNILNSAQELKNSAQELSLGKTGKLRIGYQGSAGVVVPEILDRFFHLYPDVDITVEEFGARILLQKLMNGDLDLVIAFSVAMQPPSDKSSFLRQYTIMEDDLTLFTGAQTYERFKALADSERRRLCLQDFENEKMIMISRDTNPGYYDYLQEIYRSHAFRAQYPDRQPTRFNTLMLMVQANLGVAFLPKSATLHSHPGCPYFDLQDVRAQFSIEALWHADNYNPTLFQLTELLTSGPSVMQ